MPIARLPPLAVLCLAACGAESYDLDGGDAVTAGERLVAERGCATCHQDPAQGAPRLAGTRDPLPGTSVWSANLTPDIDTGLGGWADVQIVRAIRFGVDARGLPLCPPMPHADGADGGSGAPFLSDPEARAIVAFLRALPAVSTPGGRRVSYCPPVKVPPSDLALASGGDDAGAGP